MKNFFSLVTSVLVIALCVVCDVARCSDSAEAASEKYETLIQSGIGKVFSSSSENIVEMYASYSDKSLYARDIILRIKDPISREVVASVKPETDYGFLPSFLLADFTGSGVRQIFLATDSGGSGGYGYYYVFDLSGGKQRTIFDYQTWKNCFKAAYTDGYRVSAENTETKKEYSIDLSQRDGDYLNEIYNADGTLKKPVEATVWPVGNVYPYYNSTKRIFELAVFRQISGLCHADGLGSVIEHAAWNSSQFETYYETVAVA